mgnify:CR=1 FL=1
MLLAEIVGHVVSTAKHPALKELRLMIVRPVNPDGRPSAYDFMAVDSVGAGVGERVLVVLEGRSAGDAVGRRHAPLDAAIVGIVDRVDPL